MGCSPPASWYEQQDRIYFARARREHEERVSSLLQDIEQMTPEQKQRLRRALDTEDSGAKE